MHSHEFKNGARGAARTSQEGGELFSTTCQVCHGEAGIGSSAPSLRGTKFTPGYVRQAMSEGRPGTMMPRFTGVFTTLEIEAVARYVASLQNAQRPPDSGLRGDPAAGETAFFRPQRAHSCYVCHSVNGRGGRVGPDLAQKAASKSARELFEKIVLAPHRLKDLADVNELIRVNALPAAYQERLHPYVRERFADLWQAAQTRDSQ